LPAQVDVLYNGVDPRDFDPRLRRTFQHPPPALTVLYVGHLSTAKGFGDALDAIPRVLAERPDMRFEFAGDWLIHERNIFYDDNGRPVPERGALKEQWQHLVARFPDNLRLLGTVSGSDKLEAFRRADIFLFPSYSEGFPMAVLEAMASGLPLVATPVGALAEVLHEGVHGHLVSPGDAAGLADMLLALARDDEGRLRMGERNRNEVVDRFSLEACVDGLVRCFDRWAPDGA
jgi:glycosyltransferase involved in cell wall biosynthesis